MQTIWKMVSLTGIALAVMVSAAWSEDYPKMKLRYANYIPEKAPNSIHKPPALPVRIEKVL